MRRPPLAKRRSTSGVARASLTESLFILRVAPQCRRLHDPLRATSEKKPTKAHFHFFLTTYAYAPAVNTNTINNTNSPAKQLLVPITINPKEKLSNDLLQPTARASSAALPHTSRSVLQLPRIVSMQQLSHNLAHAILRRDRQRVHELLTLAKELQHMVERMDVRMLHDLPTVAEDAVVALPTSAFNRGAILLVDDMKPSKGCDFMGGEGDSEYEDVDENDNDHATRRSPTPRESDSATNMFQPSLLDRVVDPRSGYTFMHLAVLAGSMSIIEDCLRFGSAVHTVQSLQGETPLTLAMRRFPKSVTLLFTLGHDIDVHKPLYAPSHSRRMNWWRERGHALNAALRSHTNGGLELPHFPLHRHRHRSFVSTSTATTQHRLPRGRSSASFLSRTFFPFSALGLSSTVNSNTNHNHDEAFRGTNRDTDNEGEDLQRNLLFAAVTADGRTPAWPGRLAFLQLLVDRYGVSARQEDCCGFTPALWARAHARFLGSDETERIVRFLKRAARREEEDNIGLSRSVLHMAGLYHDVLNDTAEDGVQEREQSTTSRRRGIGGLAAALRRASRGSMSRRGIVATAALATAASKESHKTHSPVSHSSPTTTASKDAGSAVKSDRRNADSPRLGTSVTWGGEEGTAERQHSATRHENPLQLHAQNTHPRRRAQNAQGENRDKAALQAAMLEHGHTRAANLTRSGKGGALGMADQMPLYRTRVDALRYALQGPVTRIVTIVLLFALHNVAYALDVSVSWTHEVRFDLWFTALNMIGSGWNGSAFFMGLVHFICALLGLLLGVVLFYYFVGRLIAVRLLRLPAFGARTDAERGLIERQFGTLYAARQQAWQRSRIFLIPVGLVVGEYIAACIYNAIVRGQWAGQTSWALIRPYMGHDRVSALQLQRCLWVITLGLDWLVLCFVMDMMYQQGALAVYLPHYSFDRFANWVDLRVMPCLRKAGALLPVQLSVRAPCADRDDDDDDSEASGNDTTNSKKNNDKAQSNSNVTSRGKCTCGLFMWRREVGLGPARLWCFWATLLFGWIVLAGSFTGALVYDVRRTSDVMAAASVTTYTNESPSVTRACLSIFFAAMCVFLVCLVAAQEWTWPTLHLHEYLAIPGTMLAGHQGWLLMLLLWAIATLDGRTIVENCRLMMTNHGERRGPAIVGLHTHMPAAQQDTLVYFSEAGNRLGAAVATLPAWFGCLALFILILSTSLRLHKAQEGAVDEEGNPIVSSSSDDKKATSAKPKPALGVALWRSWARGRHMSALPVPGAFGLMHYLFPELRQWRALNLDVRPQTRRYARAVNDNDEDENEERDGYQTHSSSPARRTELQHRQAALVPPLSATEVELHDTQTRAIAVMELLRLMRRIGLKGAAVADMKNSDLLSSDSSASSASSSDSDSDLESVDDETSEEKGNDNISDATRQRRKAAQEKRRARRAALRTAMAARVMELRHVLRIRQAYRAERQQHVRRLMTVLGGGTVRERRKRSTLNNRERRYMRAVVKGDVMD